MKNRRKNEEKRENEEKRKRKRGWKKEKIKRVQENIWSLKISEISNFFQRMGVVEKISISENLFQN